MDKVIQIDGKEVGFRATALTPRFYRHKIGRDIMQDMNQLQKSFDRVKTAKKYESKEELEQAQLSVMDLEIFENVAYIMAKQCDNTIANTVEEWLDSFSCFSIYEVLPHLIELWGLNQQTTSKYKKK